MFDVDAVTNCALITLQAWYCEYRGKPTFRPQSNFAQNCDRYMKTEDDEI